MRTEVRTVRGSHPYPVRTTPFHARPRPDRRRAFSFARGLRRDPFPRGPSSFGNPKQNMLNVEYREVAALIP
ncbi:hypothetical protein RSc0842 [Ralstonia pseudosolanacearum GMI1000]|uniref:Uncharacterized protein n=1 Tax=Ralstonia nicotianae (strain ATCC BAA-1114 / GMI1000) TaxID=267608 RepID=Q8Y150_RALN1|nr:hypothetical protein RSc0842 [Ralstonia pseudosolanacearum GMI1000]